MGLSQDAIVQVAVDITAQAGLPAVTMRAVASRLEVTPMALYRHIADREELARLVVDRIGTLVHPSPAADSPWDDRARSWAGAQRAVLRAHPGTAAWLIENGPAGPQAYRLLELLAAALAHAGLDDARIARGTALIMGWTFSRIAVEDRIELAGRDAPASGRAKAFLTALETIDPTTHPVATRIGKEFFTLPGEEVFYTGLEWILAGLRADVDPD